jgi:hypothetical protein
MLAAIHTRRMHRGAIHCCQQSSSPTSTTQIPVAAPSLPPSLSDAADLLKRLPSLSSWMACWLPHTQVTCTKRPPSIKRPYTPLPFSTLLKAETAELQANPCSAQHRARHPAAQVKPLSSWVAWLHRHKHVTCTKGPLSTTAPSHSAANANTLT